MQAATARGDVELTDYEYEHIRTSSGLQEVLETAKGCLNADGSTDNCDLLSSYDMATATPGSSTRRTTGTDTTVAEQQSTSSAAKLLVKQSLRACRSSTRADGVERTSSEIQSCASSTDNSIFTALTNATKKAATIRAMQRDLAGEKMALCMTASDGTTERCTAQAKLTHQGYSSGSVNDLDVQDALLVYRSDLYNTVWKQCNSGSSSSFAACMSSANTAAAATGGVLTEQWTRINLNALRQSAEWWCDCRETGLAEDECRNSAYTEYQRLGGDSYEWTSKDMNNAEALATSICSGDLTQLVRSHSIDHVTEFAASCSELDAPQILLDIRKAVLEVDPVLEVDFQLATQAYSSNVCSINAAILVTDSILTLADIIARVAAIHVSAEVKAGSSRRIGSFITGAIFAAEEVLECASLVTLSLPFVVFCMFLSPLSSCAHYGFYASMHVDSSCYARILRC